MKCLLLPLLLCLIEPCFTQEPSGLVLQFKMDRACELKDEVTVSPATGVPVDISPAANVHNTANTAIAFNGTSSYVTLGSIQKLKLAADKTISFWIKPVLLNTNRTGSIFTYGNGIVIGYQELNGIARMNISFGGMLYMQVNLTPDVWQSVVVTYARNFNSTQSKAIVYIDGIQSIESLKAKTAQDFTNAIALIGPAGPVSLANGFRGNLDELKIYDRTLSSSEVLMAALPAKIEFFRAKRIQQTVELQWKSSVEDNVSHYNIQRSSSGIVFATVGRQTAGQFNYFAYDSNSSRSDSWYRLEVVDRDGKKEYSSILKVGPDTTPDSSVKLYPNPGSDMIFFENIFSNYIVTIFHTNGSFIKRQTAGNKVYVGDMRPGLYYVIISDNRGLRKGVIKFIKR